VRIAVLGGTGAFGRALAARFHELGHEVAIGSRDEARAREQGAVIGVVGGANADVASNADYIVLATASGGAIDTARELREAIGRTPVLCVASDLRFTKDSVLPGRSQGSVAEDVAALLEAPVASGYQALPAAHLAHPDRLDQDVLVCGDDPAAKDPALERGAQLVTGYAIDAGPLANSRALEGMTAVILHVNRRYRVVAGLKLTGLP
jgi:8-hydroxy-5-deazaflavin:NADPH oxidoreductase